MKSWTSYYRLVVEPSILLKCCSHQTNNKKNKALLKDAFHPSVSSVLPLLQKNTPWPCFVFLEHVTTRDNTPRCKPTGPRSTTCLSYASGFQWIDPHLQRWFVEKKTGVAKECLLAGCFHIGIPQNGWFVMEISIKMDDIGGTPTFGNT